MKQNVFKNWIMISMFLLLILSLAGAASAHNVTISRTITPSTVYAGNSFDVVIDIDVTGTPGESNRTTVTENYTEPDWVISNITVSPEFTAYVDDVQGTYQWNTGLPALPLGSYQISYTMTVPENETPGTYTIAGDYQDIDHGAPGVATTGNANVTIDEVILNVYSTALENSNPGAPDPAISGSSSEFKAWASRVVDYSPSPQEISAEFNNPALALGPATGSNFDIVSLGDLTQEMLDAGDSPGSVTLGFDVKIVNGPGADIAAFENGFMSGGGLFAELGYLEVSTDGVTFARFPSINLNSLAVGGYGNVDSTYIYNMVGKHAVGWGTPFDLSDLVNDSAVLNGSVDLNNINYVRIVDIPGNGDFKDSRGNPIYDAWLTFGSGGVDLEAVGVLNMKSITDFSYNSDGSTVTISGYTGNSRNVSIPSTIDGLPVTGIDKYAFRYADLSSVTIPDSVISIGDYAFNKCTSLSSVTIGNNVTSIGKSAFSGCTGLTSVTMGSSVTSIGNGAFSSCSSLTSLNIPGSVTSIGSSVFSSCSGLTSIDIPGSITSIEANAFDRCTNLTAINVDAANPLYASIDGVLYDKAATTLMRCPAGKTAYMKIPSSVTTIETSAFSYCTGLTSLDIPDSVTSIESSAFSYCTGLTTMVIPDSVTSIGSSEFSGCSGLSSVTIPDSVTSIGNNAFRSCSSLASVSIPDSVTSIGYGAFYCCSDLSSVTLGSGVTIINNQAFQKCSGLTSMVIPESVTSIGQQAFYGCTNLSVMMFNGNAPTVGRSWAYGSSNLAAYYNEGATGFTTPEWNGVPCYPSLVAATSNFTSNVAYGSAPLTVKFTYTGVGANTWAWDFDNDGTVDSTAMNPDYTYDAAGTYSVKLNVSNPWGSESEVRTDYITIVEPVDNLSYISDGSSVTITGYTGPVGDVVIPGTIRGMPVTTIDDSAFRSNTNITSITIPDSVTTIGDSAFQSNTNINSVTFGSGVTTIGNYTFNKCTGLTSVTIPDSVTSIGDSAFSGCTALTSMTIPDSVTSLGNAVFFGCTGLTSVTIGNNVTSISSIAFRDCTSLTSITIPDSVTTIGNYAFFGCTGLTSVTIPDSVTSIGYSEFFGCTGLTSVTIGNNVTSIGNNVFRGCTSLTSITIPDSITEISSSAFRGCTSLTLMMFNGNAPTVGSNWANGNTNMVVYYHEGATGFTTPQWNEVPCYPALVAATSNFTSMVYGSAPLTVQFTYTGVGANAWAWDFDNDDTVDSTAMNPSYTYDAVGTYSVKLNVSNPWGSDSEVKIDYITIVEPVDNLSYISDGSSVTINGYSGPVGDVVIPGTIRGMPVTSIGDSTFSGCTGLTSVTIPESVTSIGESAFSGCTGLTSMTIPESVTSIGESAFSGCTGLTSVTIPESVTNIDENAFNKCTGLTSVTLGNGATNIGESAFFGCTGLTSVTLGNGVTTIGNAVFSGCTGLTSVTIPDSVTSLGNAVFSGCTALTSVTIGNNVTSIGVIAFRSCNSLTSVTIPESVTSIDKYAFRDCASLTSVTIPESVTSIGYSSFSGCTGLTSMMFNGNAPTVSRNWACGSTNLVAYYYKGATGFTTPTWEDVPCYPILPVLSFVPESTTVIDGQTTEIAISVDYLPAGLSGYNLSVEIEDPEIAEITGIEFPAWTNPTENSSLPGTSTYLKAADAPLNSEDEIGTVKPGDRNVVLANITVFGKEIGNANISITVNQMDPDNNGSKIQTSVLSGTLTVSTEAFPDPLCKKSPRDLDGDGIYEDITGNGECTFTDLELYFHYMNWIEKNRPVKAFDFNENGRIDFNDVVLMFEEIQPLE